MRQIYITHASGDEAKAIAFATALTAIGHTVWRHTHSQVGGRELATPKTHLAAATDIIAIWSEQSIRNKEVRQIAQKGLATGRLTSVLADYVKPPAGFEGAMAIDLTTWDGDPGDATARKLRDIFPVGMVAEPVMAQMAPPPMRQAPRKPAHLGLPVWPFALTAATCIAAVGVAIV